jgi:hypothetical protein
MATTITSFVPATPAQKVALFQAILAQCKNWKSGNLRPTVVFDLDGTLFDNRPRSLAIYQELFRHWNSQGKTLHVPENVGKLLYLVRDSLRALGVTDEAMLAYGEAFWRDRFFTDEYQKHDVALPGAVAFAKACYEAGANLVYFTGRDLPKMGVGSFAALRDAGLPIGIAGTELVLKPAFETPDEAFKREAADALIRVGRVVATFDNEPGNCNILLAKFPEGSHVFVDTQHAPGAPALSPAVPVITDFVFA